MTQPVEINFTEIAPEKLPDHQGRVALILTAPDKLPVRLPRAAREAALRALASKAGQALKPGQTMELAFPAGMAAEALVLVMLPVASTVAEARRAGAAIGARLGTAHTLVLAGVQKLAGEVALGMALRGYEFNAYKTADKAQDDHDPDAPAERPRVTFMVRDP